MKRRFQIGQRVAWKSGKEWKTGSILLEGDPKKNTREQLKKEFTLAYKSKRENKKPHYYVAADSLLFKPGYLVHCVPEHHLQKEETSWPYRDQLIEKLSKKDLLKIAKVVLYLHHHSKQTCPKSLNETLHQIDPKSFPIPQPPKKRNRKNPEEEIPQNPLHKENKQQRDNT
jgi:hypothetical protein